MAEHPLDLFDRRADRECDRSRRVPQVVRRHLRVEPGGEKGRAEDALAERVRPERTKIRTACAMLGLIRDHRSTIVFVNARRLAERLAARLNELAGEDLVRAHHGSIAREQRLEIEDRLKRGTLKGLALSDLPAGSPLGSSQARRRPSG